MADRALVIVNYRSAGLTREAVCSARATSAEPLEVVVVDNSCDDAERSRLESIDCDELVIAPTNLGYAGGLNLGAGRTAAAHIIASNPDVIFEPGCIDLLCGSLGNGAALAGPCFTWDDRGRWLLPPPDLLTFGVKAREALATRSARAARSRLRSRCAARVRFWSLRQTTRVPAVSGAVMAIDRAALRPAGGLDERYRLYFEEIDLMMRLSIIGLDVVYVPDARCRHIYNQSAAGDQEHDAKYGESEQAYLAKWYGTTLAWMLRRAMKTTVEWPAPAAVESEAGSPIVIPGDPKRFVVEASPLVMFDSAAGHFPDSQTVLVPQDVWATYRAPKLHVRVVELATLEPVASYVFSK